MQVAGAGGDSVEQWDPVGRPDHERMGQLPPPAAEHGWLPAYPVEEPAQSASSFVRPYVFTRGRTRTTFDLSIETLVEAVAQEQGAVAAEHALVLSLCVQPRSVAEVAALAGVPLGVARVLVGDLAETGAVSVHRTAGAEGPDLALMERVLRGLHQL